MKDLTKPGEALGGIRKLLQDVIAPEVQGIKATLTSLHEGQQLIRDDLKLMREEMKVQDERLRAELKMQDERLRKEMKAQEARLTHLIEAKARETILTVQLAESERRSAEAERRNAELVRRLEESGGAAASAKQ